MLTCSNLDIQKSLKAQKNGNQLLQSQSSIYSWDPGSTYVKKPPFFDGMPDEPEGFKEIKDARPLLILGDMITTDHISPSRIF